MNSKFLPFTPLLSKADKNVLAELEKHGREPLRPGEGTLHTSHPAVTSTALCHLTLPSPPSTRKPCLPSHICFPVELEKGHCYSSS